jgi:hypothetical protein
MKTTVELSDQLLREARRAAADENTSVRALIEEGLRAALARRREDRPFTLRQASFKGDGSGWTDAERLGFDPRSLLRREGRVTAVDTNLLVYAHREDSDWHRAAAELVRGLAEGRSA